MGISMYNASGYRDPTAFAAISRAESFRVDHSTGFIDVDVNVFFPCTVKKADKFFRLVCQYCSEEQQDRLLDALLRRADRLKAQAESQEEKVSAAKLKSAQYREELAELRRIQSTEQRLRRNIRDFELRRLLG